MTPHVNDERKQRKKPKIQAVHDEVNEGAPDSSACEVFEFEQELKAIRAYVQSRATYFAADEAGTYLNFTNFKDETLRLKGEIEITIQSVQESEFYSLLVKQLHDNGIVQSNMRRVFGDKLQMDIVIYGLGSIQYSYASQYQLALALLLQRQFPWIGAIEAFDPLFTCVDKKTMEMLGCNVPAVNELCKKRVDKPTLFCLPYVYPDGISNLLEANWCPARLNNMVILGPSFKYLAASFGEERSNSMLYGGDILENRYEYIEAISKHAIEVKVVTPKVYRCMFEWCTWHFFPLDAGCDLNRLLPSDIPTRVALLHRRLYDNWVKKVGGTNCPDDNFVLESHYEDVAILKRPFTENPKSTPRDWALANLTTRDTRAIRCFWQPPPTGWVKLNFSVKARGGDTAAAGFGGVFHDGQKNCLAVYCGSLKKADPVVAAVESLRWGLKILKMVSTVTKLVIEGDDLRIIRWLNRGPDSPMQIAKPLSDIFQLLESREAVIRHVYEEANAAAAAVAERGATLEEPGFWLCTKNDSVIRWKTCAN